MNIVLNPGFSGFISVENLKGKEVFKQNVSSLEDMGHFFQTYGKSTPGYPILKASFIPTRTDNIQDLVKDLFLPTFINHALKVHSLIGRIFASIAAIALDIATFVPRFFIAPLKAYSDYTNKDKHPLVNLLKSHSGASQAIKDDVLKIKVAVQAVKISQDPILKTKTAKEFTMNGYQLVVVKALPGIKKEAEFKHRTADYIEIEGEWDVHFSISGTSKTIQDFL